MSTHRTHPTRRLVTAASALALALGAIPTLLHGQTPQTTPTAKPPWQVGDSTHNTFPGGKVPATPTKPSTSTATAITDSAYVREAIGANRLEVRMGTLASQRASNSAVRQFAQTMVTDHTSMGQQWTSLASQSGLPSSVALTATQQQSYDVLSRISGAEFDRQYMQAMISDHEQDVSALQRMASSARSSQVKELATSSLSTTQQQLATARQVAGQVGTPGAVATNAPVSPSNTNPAAGRRNNGRGENNRADGKYAQELAYDHILELRLARLAEKRAKDKDVKQFAKRVTDDFPKWQDRWTNLASRHGNVEVNQNMGPSHREKIDRLEKASRGNFDQMYVNIVTEHLGSIVPYLQKEGRDAKSADVRNAASDELPLVRDRLNDARRLDGQVQASVKGKGRSLSEKK